MAHDLIEATDVEARIGRTLTADETTQANAFITDASALVRDVAGTDFHDDDGNELPTPSAIVPVLVSMVRRAFENPLGSSSEDIGDYRWQGRGTIYLTKRERSIVRRAAGKLGVGAVTLEGYTPLRYEYWTFDDNLIGS